jgi:hypothetical protein
MTPSANIPFEHKVRLIMLVDDDPPCGAARNAGLIRSAGQIARDLAEGLEHHGVVKLDRVGIGGPAECERADNAAGVFATAPAIMIAGPGVRSRERRKLARNVNVHRSH